jgi:hypothetical protein
MLDVGSRGSVPQDGAGVRCHLAQPFTESGGDLIYSAVDVNATVKAHLRHTADYWSTIRKLNVVFIQQRSKRGSWGPRRCLRSAPLGRRT